MNNFFGAISAVSKDIWLFITDIIYNKSFMGFFVGIFIATLVSSLIITRNPKHIPLILRYSTMESFEKISKRDKKGTYQMAFTNFIKIYTQTRTLFLISMISFCVMITTVALTNNVN